MLRAPVWAGIGSTGAPSPPQHTSIQTENQSPRGVVAPGRAGPHGGDGKSRAWGHPPTLPTPVTSPAALKSPLSP